MVAAIGCVSMDIGLNKHRDREHEKRMDLRETSENGQVLVTGGGQREKGVENDDQFLDL